MKKRAALLLSLAMLFAAMLPACSGGKETLYVYNWGWYIDEEVNRMFEKEFGVRVVYELYDSNEDLYAKLKSGTSNYDVIFPSDYMVEKMIKENMLAEINLANIPNFANIQDRLKNLAYDPGNRYTIPYFWGTVGILYNTKKVDDPTDTWQILWNKKYSKQILMYDSQRDSLGITLKMLGYSLNTRDESQILEAQEKLIAQRPLVYAYLTDQIMDSMAAGNAALGVVYSGDAVYAMSQNEDLDYSVPLEGSNVWYDAVAIPASAKNKALAEKYIDFLCRDDIAMMNTVEVMYSTPNKNVLADLEGEDWVNDAYTVPDEVLERCEQFLDPGTYITLYQNAWENVKNH